MNGELRAAYDAELRIASTAIGQGDSDRAFRSLERAHILSQRHTWRHVRVHWRMLKLGVALGDRCEILGQLSRMLAASLFSRIWSPVGNTGRADVSAMMPMAVPEDLRRLLD